MTIAEEWRGAHFDFQPTLDRFKLNRCRRPKARPAAANAPAASAAEFNDGKRFFFLFFCLSVGCHR